MKLWPRSGNWHVNATVEERRDCKSDSKGMILASLLNYCEVWRDWKYFPYL